MFFSWILVCQGDDSIQNEKKIPSIPFYLIRDRKVLINRTTAVPVTAKSKKSYLELSAIEVINHWSYQPLKISAIEISFSLKLDLKAMRVLMCFETYKKKTSLSSFISSRDLVLDFVFLRGYG